MPHFARPNTQQLLKTPVKSSLLSPNSCTTQIIVVPLHHKNPPSLSTMLKSAGRFIYMKYNKKYSSPFELLSILQSRGLTIPVFISWMTVVTLTRNSCCHHARLWNRSLSLRTLTMTRPLTPWVSSNVRQGRIFFTLCILKHFVDIIWSNKQ